tara:strand:- start:3825 stop:6248 length:2424 start_codon:yes stop_codon:yes gene_type:complete
MTFCDKDDATTDYQYFLLFNASASEPDLESAFIDGGGQINAAASRGKTDFSLSGSDFSYDVKLTTNGCIAVSMPIPKSQVVKCMVEGTDSDSEKITLALRQRVKLNVSNTRGGAGIAGAFVDTHAGAGSEYLINVLKRCTTHCNVPIQYGTWSAFSSVVCISGAHVMRVAVPTPKTPLECHASSDPDSSEDDEAEETDTSFGNPLLGMTFQHYDAKPVHGFTFVESVQEDDELLAGAKIVEQWANIAWALRKVVRYKYSPTLTKTVAKMPTNTGIAGQGYVLVHDVLDAEWAFQDSALESLMQHAISNDLGHDGVAIAEFMRDTGVPGLAAAARCNNVAAALSVGVNHLIAYRSDGRTQIGASGATFGSTESWLRMAMRTPFEANDCDGSAVLINIMLSHIAKMHKNPDIDLPKKFPWLNAVHNVIHPFYTPVVAVLGANASSADAATGDGSRTKVAGHAIAMLMPTLQLLDALDKGNEKHWEGKTIGDNAEKRDTIAEARYQACFGSYINSLKPSDTRIDIALKKPWMEVRKVRALLKDLLIMAPEGTTPASPVLYIADAAKRAAAEKIANRENIAYNRAKPHIARAVKILHVGGHDKADPHKFYHDIVEVTVHPKHPLFSDDNVRELGAACTQFFLANQDVDTDGVKEAGATPRELVEQHYIAAPLFPIGTAYGKVIDAASERARADVIPPRASTRTQPFLLSAFQHKQLKRSIAALKRLDAQFEKDSSVDQQCVQYVFSLASLVHNPTAIMQFCSRMVGPTGVAVSGMVDFHTVDGLLQAAADDGVGTVPVEETFVIVNAIMNV